MNKQIELLKNTVVALVAMMYGCSVKEVEEGVTFYHNDYYGWDASFAFFGFAKRARTAPAAIAESIYKMLPRALKDKEDLDKVFLGMSNGYLHVDLLFDSELTNEKVEGECQYCGSDDAPLPGTSHFCCTCCYDIYE